MIKLINITKLYGEQVVLSNLSLNIPTNETSCIMAPSGYGKTTLLKLLMGLDTYQSGQIEGMENAKISAVFQEDRLCESLGAVENILLPHIGKDSFNLITKNAIDEGLLSLGLQDIYGKKTSELSGGMKRRVTLLRALYANYDILILDEPFKGLDDDTKKLTMDYVKKITVGKTVIVVTHHEEEAKYMAGSNIYLLNVNRG